MANTGRQYSGVRRGQEVSRAARREDTRKFGQKLYQWSSTEKGTVGIFGLIAGASLLLSWAPFIPEALFLTALALFFKYYALKKRKWSLPMRVPAYLSKRMKRPVVDATTNSTGKANLMLGMDLESAEEVWLDTEDVNKHALIIGTTGSGKTEAIMGHYAGFLALGSGGLIVDGKASVNTFDSAYKISRYLGRDADLFVMDYLTGGKDIIGPQQHRRSHTYNPLGFGGSAQKSEVMVSLLDGEDDMWKGRAIQFLEGVIPPMSFLAEQGFVLLNPSLIASYLNLNVIENFVLFGLIQDLNGKLVWLPEEYPSIWNALQSRMSALKLYLDGLPSFNLTRFNEPIYVSGMNIDEYEALKPRIIAKRDKSLETPGDKQQRGETEKQHGFITMQLTRSISSLKDSYGFIYNAEVGEISYYDAVLNRRSLMVLLPSLERSPSNLSMLGKMTVLSVKSVLGALLNTAPEGSRRQIIEGNPSNSSIPYLCVLDEVGYYVVPGTSVIPAQARSMGVAVYFGTQDIPSLSKGSEAEGKAILDNTALKMIGRVTSDAESETSRTAIQLAGKVSTQVASSMEFKRDSLGIHNSLKLTEGSSLDEEFRISYNDLTRQENGEFHVLIGTKEFDQTGKESGGQRLARILSFYTGNVPNVDTWRRNPYVTVKSPSVAEINLLRETERAERRFRSRLADLLEGPSEGLLIQLRTAQETIFGEFYAWRKAQIQSGSWAKLKVEEKHKAMADWIRSRNDRIHAQIEWAKTQEQAAKVIAQAKAAAEMIGDNTVASGLLAEVSARWSNTSTAISLEKIAKTYPDLDADALAKGSPLVGQYLAGAFDRHGEGDLRKKQNLDTIRSMSRSFAETTDA